MPDVVATSALAAPPAAVFDHATSLEGINFELRPWMRMTAPPGIVDLSTEPVVGRPWFHTWMLLLGFLPYDRMHLMLVELDLDQRRFAEQSQMWWMRSWRHERSVEAVDGGSRLTDRLSPEPRVPGTGPLVRAVVRALFAHRHRRLVRRFGAL